MTTSFPLSPDAAAYLAALRAELSDLPADERDDLLADVEASLSEAGDDGEGTVAARLGSPARFAAELRAAAGIGPAPNPPGYGAALAAAVRRLQDDPRIAPALRPLGELAPIWWLVRGILAAGVLGLLVGVSWSVPRYGLPHAMTGRWFVLGFVVLVIASLWLGLSRRRVTATSAGRGLLVAVNVGLAIAAIPIYQHVVAGSFPVREIAETVEVPVAPEALTYGGAEVRNLYPYTRSGRLLQDVLLYDEGGNPVNVGSPAVPDPDRRLLTTTRGNQIYNSFPIRYFEPETTLVAHPYAGPSVLLPQLLTPRLVAVAN